MTDREDVPSMTDTGNVIDTGNSVMHMGALEESAIQLIEACAEQKEPITIPDAVRRTVDQHYPLDADRYEAWGMWIERLQQFGELHCQESFGKRLDEFGGTERTGYEQLQALVRTLAAMELQWSLENNPIYAEAKAKAASEQ